MQEATVSVVVSPLAETDCGVIIMIMASKITLCPLHADIELEVVIRLESLEGDSIQEQACACDDEGLNVHLPLSLIRGPPVGKLNEADILVKNKANNSLDKPPEDYVRIPKFVQNVDKMKNSSLEQIKKEKNPNECIKFGQKFPKAKGVKVPRYDIEC